MIVSLSQTVDIESSSCLDNRQQCASAIGLSKNENLVCMVPSVHGIAPASV